MRTCSIDGCQGKHRCKGLCTKHYASLKSYGDPLRARTISKREPVLPGHEVTRAIWHGMKNRCLNPKNKKFADYGGRGISVCERWLVFANFVADMGLRPEGLTLERRENDDGYEPSNCFWATRAEQARNKRTTRMVVLNGKHMPLIKAAEIIGIKPKTIKRRISLGWSVERAVSTPVPSLLATDNGDARRRVI
jgi:hypothetical protein